jgi:hypothetical protein
MTATLTTAATASAALTISAYRQARWVNGWIVINRIVFPR